MGWHPNTAAKWGSFTTWSPETAVEWRAQGWNPADMKYWLNKGFTITDADKWKLLGHHSNLGDHPISLEQWGSWRETTSITEAANWIEAGFTPELVVKWMDNGISPRDAKIFKEVLYPEEAVKWLNTGIPAKLATCWKAAILDPYTAGEFFKMKISPEEAAQWTVMGANAAKATYFVGCKWNLFTVANWLHTNKSTYKTFHVYMHLSKSPERIMAWSKTEFGALEAKLWMQLEIDIDLACNFKSRRITPQIILSFTERGYTMEEAVDNIVCKISLTEAKPPKNGKTQKDMSYSKRMKKGLDQTLNPDGFLPFTDRVREMLMQGNLFQSLPCLTLPNTMRIHFNNLNKGSMDECFAMIFSTLDKHFPDREFAHKWLAEHGYVDVGFTSNSEREAALSAEFSHEGIPLKVESTRYANQLAKWVTFMDVPTTKPREWTHAAITTGLSYYMVVIEIQEEMANMAKCLCLTVIHALVEIAPSITRKNIKIPRFICLPEAGSQVIYVKPENKRQICRFCYCPGHSFGQCLHKKGVHPRSVDYNPEDGVSRVNGKEFLCPRAVWWFPASAKDSFAMEALQGQLKERHKRDWA
ncbi:hypothetical protein DSO57_1037906 [Entomophthora muscae]|uniref:Uncharacterized protein n=1 Tax=Entomophthora muscae TaxID=34485 RepID=A0ACC2TKQ3_9FUNG|nr:hypothetical protein DSO57_1037906 [Entomophthora muscae]